MTDELMNEIQALLDKNWRFKMKIIIAENCGFCYGVKRAVEMALKTVKDKNKKVATLAPL